MHRIALFILRIMGWRIVGEYPPIHKYIIAVVPHTANMDFVIGRLVGTVMRANIYFLIKKELFFFPLGAILRFMNAIPINRKSPKSVIETVVRKINETDRFVLAVTPEGTRSKVTRWKKGFYYIAQKSEIPILPASVDYGKKRIVFGELLYPGSDERADYKKLLDFYQSISPVGKYPERFVYPEI